MDTRYRPDIDGLRAVAVLGVVVFHAFPGVLPGGFTGVDIFFVISGFLISSILLGRLGAGTFSLRDFYARRVRRLFPALALVLAATWLAGWLLLFPEEYASLLKHVAAGAGFVSNFALWGESGYFDAAAETKPLLHLWSLGIEEQFYILWPVLLWAAWRCRLPAAPVIAALLAVSFLLNLAGIAGDRVGTFYSPQTRAWELLVGALLAAGVAPVRAGAATATVDVSPRVRNLLALAGVVLVAWAMLVFTRYKAYPGAWAWVPTLGAALLIGAGPDAWFNRRVLGSRLLVGIGLISFPLYLWHWPLLAFARIVEGGLPPAGVRVALVVVAFVLAWLTWAHVERPFRAGASRPARTRAALLPVAAIGVLALLAWQARMDPRLDGTPAATAEAAGWRADAHRRDAASCRALVREPGVDCLTNMAPAARVAPAIVIIGDSHAQALARGLLALPSAPAFVAVTKLACPPLPGVERYVDGIPDRCPRGLDWFLAGLARGDFRDAVVVIGARSALYVEGRGYGGEHGHADAALASHLQRAGTRYDPAATRYAPVFEQGLRDLLAQVTPRVRGVVFVHQVPELGFPPSACRSRVAGRTVADCAVPRAAVDARQRGYRAVVDHVLQDFPAVRVIDPLAVLCDEHRCAAVRGDDVLYRDDDHLAAPGAALLAATLLAGGDHRERRAGRAPD